MDKKTPEEFIPTKASLLGRLKNLQDDDSWREFFNIYRRLVYSTAIKAGLTEVESEEVVQETLISVAKAIPNFQYDRKRCTFKSWLGQIVRRRIADQFRKRGPLRAAEPAPGGSDSTRTPLIERLPDPQSLDLDSVWDEEWQARLLAAAMEKVKMEVSPEQFQIFNLYVVRKKSAAEVASSLAVSIGQVYLAKHRVSRLIKQEVRRLEAQMNSGLRHG